MYERFTDRARKVMQLANQEAQRFNHEYIGTEHILLGLVKEGSGVAANVLKNLDIDLRRIRLEVENLKMESFGLEILHAVGATYVQKGTSFLKSQKFLGISGFFSRLKDKGSMVKDTWGTVSPAIQAQKARIIRATAWRAPCVSLRFRRDGAGRSRPC